jgi:hypothetical protein
MFMVVKTSIASLIFLLLPLIAVSCRSEANSVDRKLSFESAENSKMKINFNEFKNKEELLQKLNSSFPKGTDLNEFLASAKESEAQCSIKADLDAVIDNPDKDLVLSSLETDYVCQYVSQDRGVKASFGVNIDEQQKIDTIEGYMMFLSPFEK